MVTRYVTRLKDAVRFVSPEMTRSPLVRGATLAAGLAALGGRNRHGALLAAASGLLAVDSAQQSHETRRAVDNGADVVALTAWLPDHGMEFGGYAIDADLASVLRSRVRHGHVRSIVEFGAGLSTLTTALALQERGGAGEVISFEASREFAQQVTALLARKGLSERARVVHAPLGTHTIDGRTMRWHDPGLVTRETPDRIDLLFVDGPVSVDSWSRWPALEVLWESLNSGASILLDDGRRRREHHCALRWAEAHMELELSWIDTVTGVWCAEVRDQCREGGPSQWLHTVMRTINPRPAGWGKSAVRRI